MDYRCWSQVMPVFKNISSKFCRSCQVLLCVQKDSVQRKLTLAVLEWLYAGSVQKLVLVITSLETQQVVKVKVNLLLIMSHRIVRFQVLERWNFDIETEKEGVHNPDKEFDKSEKDIMSEIQAIIRQITASVTFLPLLQDACTFDLLVIYTY
jgi:mitotic spindle assembly checkpoint protein MAD2